MKKNLLIALLFLLAAGTLRADLIWYEGYNYSNGPIISVATNIWFKHSGSASPSDAIVSNSMEQVSTTGGTLTRQDDVHRLFTNGTTIYTNTIQQLYASFTIIATNLTGGTNICNFAHFLNGSSAFYGKLWAGSGSLPGTYRLGTTGTASTASLISYFPRDLITNAAYQVVLTYDPASSRVSTLWINPLGSSDTSVSSFDVVTNSVALHSFAFRQASSSGNFFALITNLTAATTFDEAATNIASTNPVTPAIVSQPIGFTNFVGASNALTVFADGQSLANLTYQWYQGSTPITTVDGNTIGNTNFLSFPNAQASDSGTYKVVVTTTYGLSVTSSPVIVNISTAPVPPSITSGPASQTVYTNQTVTFSVTVSSPGNISYQWKSNNVNISGANASTFTLTGVQTNFSASYSVGVTNDVFPTGVVSSNAVLTVLVPPVVNIHTLRGLVDATFYLPTNTTLYYTTTGTVISKTNFTTAANDEFFITDGTGSIAVFFGGGAGFRPNFGDVVTVTGPLNQFNSLMEFSLSATDPSTSATIISTGNPAPISTVLPLTFTNSAAFGGTSNALRNFGGALATFNNVTITPNGTNNFAASGSYILTDGSGNTLTLFIYSGFADIIGTPVPAFAYNVTGVLSEFLGATAPDRSSGYQLEISEPSDIVTTPPPAVTLSMSKRGVLNWTAVPYTYNYSVAAAANIFGPYTNLATGLIFPTAAGSYTDTNITAAARFYRVTAP